MPWALAAPELLLPCPSSAVSRCAVAFQRPLVQLSPRQTTLLHCKKPLTNQSCCPRSPAFSALFLLPLRSHQCPLPFHRRSVSFSSFVRTEELRREAHAHPLSLPRRSSHPELKHIVNASAAPNLSGYPVVVIIAAPWTFSCHCSRLYLL